MTTSTRAYAGAVEARRDRLKAIYATKPEFVRARTVYRNARRAYAVACQAVQAAKASLGDAQRAYDNAFRDAYAEWRSRQPQSSYGARLRAVRELARIRGISVTQMARLLGYRAERTSDELAEDLYRYLTGTPVLAIARERGISRQAVYDRIRYHTLGAVPSMARAGERVNSDTRGQ